MNHPYVLADRFEEITSAEAVRLDPLCDRRMAAPTGGMPPSSFRFAVRTSRLDWRALAEVEVERVARETDIDALERVLDTVCYGDVTVEDPRHVSGEEGAREREGGRRAGGGRRDTRRPGGGLKTCRVCLWC